MRKCLVISYKPIHSSVPVLQAQSLSGRPLNFLKKDGNFTPKKSPSVKGDIKMPRLAIRGIQKGFFWFLLVGFLKKMLDIEQLLHLELQDLHNTHYSKAPIFTRTSQLERFCGTVSCAFHWPMRQGRAGVMHHRVML